MLTTGAPGPWPTNSLVEGSRPLFDGAIAWMPEASWPRKLPRLLPALMTIVSAGATPSARWWRLRGR